MENPGLRCFLASALIAAAIHSQEWLFQDGANFFLERRIVELEMVMVSRLSGDGDKTGGLY